MTVNLKFLPEKVELVYLLPSPRSMKRTLVVSFSVTEIGWVVTLCSVTKLPIVELGLKAAVNGNPPMSYNKSALEKAMKGAFDMLDADKTGASASWAAIP